MPYFTEEIRQFQVFMSPKAGKRVQETLYSGFVGQGARVDDFEKALEAKLGARVLTTNSGTSALQLALHLVPKPNRFVFTTPLTCFATTAAILNSGMEPYWIDVDPKTCNMDLEHLREKMKSIRPAAIMVVHYGGYPVDLKLLNMIADGVPVIEDCAHAFGSYTPEGHVGTMYGNYGCFSFQAIKTLTTGDGGALIVPEEQYERAKKLRWFGLSRDEPRYGQNIQEAGFKYQMNDIAASIGLANLEYVDENLRSQRNNVRLYQQALPHNAPAYEDEFKTSGWMYPVRVSNARDFDVAMKLSGIATGIGHDRNDLHDCVKRFRKHLPGLECAVRTVSCIPSGWWLTPAMKEHIIENVKQGW